MRLPFVRSFQYRVECVYHHCLNCCDAFLDKALRVAGPVLIAMAVILVSGIAYVHFTTLLPARVGTVLRPSGMLHLVLSMWLLFNICFNYVQSIRVKPGTTPPADLESGSTSRAGFSHRRGFSRWCKRCHKPKPPLSHHCHVCSQCVLKMDHHCPWINNCVGWYNYRFFFLFLFYMWASAAYVAGMSFTPLFHGPHHGRPETSLVFTFTLAVAVFVALLLLGGWHVYLILTAQTTIEYHVNRQKREDARQVGEVWVNEFDLGMYSNWCYTMDVSGPFWWLTWMLPRLRLPKGNGCSFPVRKDCSPPVSCLNSPSIHRGNNHHHPQFHRLLP